MLLRDFSVTNVLLRSQELLQISLVQLVTQVNVMMLSICLKINWCGSNIFYLICEEKEKYTDLLPQPLREAVEKKGNFLTLCKKVGR